MSKHLTLLALLAALAPVAATLADDAVCQQYASQISDTMEDIQSAADADEAQEYRDAFISKYPEAKACIGPANMAANDANIEPAAGGNEGPTDIGVEGGVGENPNQLNETNTPPVETERRFEKKHCDRCD